MSQIIFFVTSNCKILVALVTRNAQYLSQGCDCDGYSYGKSAYEQSSVYDTESCHLSTVRPLLSGRL